MSGVYSNSSNSIYATNTELIDLVNQLSQVSAIAPFIQTTNALASWNTSDPPGIGSNHNLLDNSNVLLDPNTGNMTQMNSLSFNNGNITPPLAGSVWLNDSNNHLYHGGVDLEATGGNVSSNSLTSVTGNIASFSDTSGIIIGDSGINIDNSQNINNTNSITFNNNVTDPITGSLWLNSMDNHLYHGTVDLETVGTGDVIGPPNAIPNEITLFNALDGKVIKKSNVFLDSSKNIVSLKSVTFDTSNMIPNPGSLWLNNGDNHLYHGSVDLEEVGTGDVMGPGFSIANTVPIFTDGTGKVIGNSGVLIDSSKNVNSFKSILFNPSNSEPVSGSLWLNNSDNHLYHGANDIEGNVIGPPISTDSAIALYSGSGGNEIKDSSIIVDNNANITNLNSISLIPKLSQPILGSMWLDTSTNHIMHNSIDMEKQGDVVGPNLSINNNFAAFDLTSGKILKDSGVNSLSFGDVTGPASAINNNLCSYNLATGKLIKDSGILSTNVVQGPASSVSGNVTTYNGLTGKLIQDSGILASNLVQGPASAVNNNFAAFDLTTGKLIKDSGVNSLSFGDVTGPASSTNGELTIYSGTTGKLVTNSGIIASAVGDVKGPASAINNNLCSYNLTTGKLIKDSGILSTNVVQGPASSVSGNVTTYNGLTGKLIQDSGILASNLVQGPASAVNNNLATFDLATGKLIKDSGILSTNVVQGPASAVNNNLATFDLTTGKLIKDSGILASNLVQGPASAVNNNLATFDLVTGKLIKDSGILSTNVVQGPASSVSGNVSTYNGLTGKLIQDSGILASNLVQGPASAVNNNLVAFDLTTGKLIKDSGISTTGTLTGISIITDVKANNTNGGNFTSGAWQTRILNNIVTNGTSGASLSANQITLTAGTYRMNGYAPARNVNSHQTRIQNITDATTTILGGCQYSEDANGVLGIGGGIATSNSDFDGIFTIVSTKVFELQHRCSSTQNTTGFGIATNFGNNCIYSKVIVTKYS